MRLISTAAIGGSARSHSGTLHIAVYDKMAGPGPIGVFEARARAVGLSGGLLARTPPLLPQPRGMSGPQASADAVGRGETQSITLDLDALGNAGLSLDVDDFGERQWSWL